MEQLQKRLLRALRRNVLISKFIHAKLENYMRKLRADGFLLLKYSVQKQIALRESLFIFKGTKARELATCTLKMWFAKSLGKIVSRESLSDRIQSFQKRRFFITMRSALLRREQSVAKIVNFIRYRQGYLMHSILSVMHQRASDPKFKAKQKALSHLKTRVLSGIFKGL